MDNLFVLQTKDGSWEEVDDYIYQNHKFVVNAKDEPRYSGNRFSVTNAVVNLTDLSVNADELGMIARITGAKIPHGSTPDGFAPKPDVLLRIKKGRSLIFYEVETGTRYKLAS